MTTMCRINERVAVVAAPVGRGGRGEEERADEEREGQGGWTRHGRVPTSRRWPLSRAVSADGLRGEVLAHRLGEHEAHVLADDLELLDGLGAALAEEGDEPMDQLLGG